VWEYIENMDNRKVQQLGSSTLAISLPAEWTKANQLKKGDNVSLQTESPEELTVITNQYNGNSTNNKSIIEVDKINKFGLRRTVIAHYVLGRHEIEIVSKDGLTVDQIDKIQSLEGQLMGVGIIEHTNKSLTVRCSVDVADFSVGSLIKKLGDTGAVMREEAIKSIQYGNVQLAEKAIRREKQANKIFILLLRVIFTSHQNSHHLRSVNVPNKLSLIGYHSVAKNLELTADNAEDIAKISIEINESNIEIPKSIIKKIINLENQANELSKLGVEAVITRDFNLYLECHELFREIRNAEQTIYKDLGQMNDKNMLRIYRIWSSLFHTSEYAIQNAEIAANLSFFD